MSNNRNGFIVPTNSTAEEFADKIQHFIDQPNEIERMGRYALEFSKNYDICHYTDKLIEIYLKE
jgi:glycosyltransferase involved in cell wall biosynthesis